MKDQPAATARIIGPLTEARLDDALPVLEMRLGREFAELDEIVPPGSALADFHNTSGWMRMKLTS